MPPKERIAQRFDDASTHIPTCDLTEEARRQQRARFSRLGRQARRVRREPEAVIIEFQDGFDRQALDEALAIERECCSFFRFAFKEPDRRLQVTVAEHEQLSALEAMAQAMSLASRG